VHTERVKIAQQKGKCRVERWVEIKITLGKRKWKVTGTEPAMASSRICGL
jgi:hypothetical protein